MNLFIDIETIPGWILPVVENIKTPANYKDPEKIKAYQLEHQEEAYRKQALNSMEGRIVCIGFCLDDNEPTLYTNDEEYWVIDEFADAMNYIANNYRTSTPTWTGWNIFTFDIPWLWRKSIQHDRPDLRRLIPKDNRQLVCDLMRVWAADFKDYVSLASCADFLGIKHEGNSGSEIYDLWKAGDYKAIEEHCKRDLITTREIYRRVCG